MSIHIRLRAMTIRRLGVGRGGQGSPATLHKISKGEYNPDTGEMEGAGSFNYQGSGLRVNYTTFEYRDVSILKGDYKLYLCPVLINGEDCPPPKLGDTVTFDNDVYKVINMEAWNASGLECGWKCQMRKG